MVEPGPRRKLSRTALALAASSIAASLALGAAAWVMVPRWFPEFVLTHSPWVEPMMRAAASQIERDAAGEEWVEFELDSRITDWGVTAMPGLGRAYAIGGRIERRLCIAALDSIPGNAGLPLAARAVHDPDAEVRRAAVHEVGELGTDETAVSPLIDALDDRDEQVRQLAAHGLAWLQKPKAVAALVGRHDPRILPLLVYELEEDWRKTREHHENGVIRGFLEARDARTLALLRAGLSSPSAERRTICACWLAESDHDQAPQSIAALAPLLHDPDPAAAAAASEGIIGLAAPVAEKALLAILRDPSPRARCVAAAALGRVGTAAAFAALIDALSDQDTTVRRNVYVALRDHGDASALTPLRALVAGATGETLHLAIDTLGSIGGAPTEPEMIAFLSHRDPRVRWIAASQISRFGSPAALAALTKLLDDEDADVRTAAANALPRCGPSALAALTRAADDRDPEVAEQARAGLALLGSKP